MRGVLLVLVCIFVGSHEGHAADSFLPQAVGQYLFSPDECVQGSFPNLLSPNVAATRLARDPNTTSCAPSQSLGVTNAKSATAAGQDGVRAGIHLQGSVGTLLERVQSNDNGLTLELWFKPATNDTGLRPIFTLGQEGPVQNSLNYCDSNSLDFQMAQRGGVLEIYYRTSDLFFEPCQRYALIDMPLPANKLAHVMISLQDAHQQVFVNGQASDVLMQSFQNDLSHWNTIDGGSKLHLLAFQQAGIWKGSLYQFGIYPGIFATYGVQERLLAGLPPSLPYAVNTTVRIHEDAESGAGSHPAEWYTRATTVAEAVRINLQVAWLDQEVRELLDSINLKSSTPLASVYVYVTELPEKGRLYLPGDNGRALDDSSSESTYGVLVPVSMDPSAEVVYLPPPNQHSNSTEDVYATFSYCVVASLVFNAQQCDSAEIHVIVDPVNDPPMALSVEPVTVFEGVETLDTPKILLSGMDVDVGDIISSIQVTQPPAHGHLTLSVSSFRKDGLLHGTHLSVLDFIVGAEDTVYVKYIWNPNSTRIVQGNHVQDSFKFRVADRAGLWSTEKTVEIKVVSAVTAIADTSFTVREDSRQQMNLLWHGEDESGYQRRIGYYVESVPASNVGVLLDPSTQKPISSGTMLVNLEDFPYGAGVDVTFVPSPNYCNSHKTTLDSPTSGSESQILFRAVAVARDGDTVTSTSDVVTQPIRVECVIDTLIMTGPSGPFQLKQSSLHRAASDPCHGSVFDPVVTDLAACDAAVMINGIDVKSSDRHVEQARVTVLAGNGYLTFNEQSWSLARPIYGRRAVGANNVTFLANPDDLADILSHLHFQSYRQGMDAIDILIEYGNCSPALVNRSAMPFQTSDCQFLRHTIAVVVGKDEKAGGITTQLVMGFPWQILLCMLGYPALYYILVQGEARWKLRWGDDETVTAPDDTDELDGKLPDWIQHKSDTGEFYYENTANGSVTWTAPVGERYIRWKGDEEEKVEDNLLKEA
jgi:hypothetical protein